MQPEFFIYFISTFILFNLAIIPFYKNVRYIGAGITITNNRKYLALVKWGILIFCVFGVFAGDWLHQKDEIAYICSFSTIPEQDHLEDLYVWIIWNITGNTYILYRFLIWGVAICCLSAGFKRLGMDTIATWCTFLVLSVAISYAVGRGCLGFSLIIWGYSYLLKPDKQKILSYTKGLVLLFLSLFCHKSMLLLAPMTLVSFVNLNLKRIIAVIIIIPLVIGIFQKYIIMKLISGDDVAGRAYFTDQQNVYGIGMLLWQYSYYFIIYSSIAFVFYRIKIKKQYVPTFIKRIFNLVLLMLIEYIVIYYAFTYQKLGNDDLAWRIFAMINIPLPIVISYFFSTKVPRYFLYIFNYAFLMANYFILYNAYTNYF